MSSHGMEYVAIVERSGKSYSAYFPDVPGCVATGSTIELVKTRIAEALEMHLGGLRELNQPIPAPNAFSITVEAPH